MMREKAYRHLMMAFNLPAVNIHEAGAMIQVDDTRKPSEWQTIWTLGEQTVVQTHPRFAGHFHSLIQSHNALCTNSLQTELPILMGEQENFYSINSQDHMMCRAGYDIRQLGSQDERAFTAFLTRCSERDRQYAEVSLNDEIIYGAVAGTHIVAAASTFDWHGFVDFGVLTDPAYRQRGLGTALISAIVQHYLTIGETRPLLYRHEASNTGSKKIADAVGWKRFATADYVQFKESTKL